MIQGPIILLVASKTTQFYGVEEKLSEQSKTETKLENAFKSSHHVKLICSQQKVGMRQKSTRLELVELIRSLLQTHAKGS